MKPHFSTRYVLVALALTLTVAAGLTLTGAASAQEGVQVSTNATDEPEPVEGRVGPIVIQDYELRDSTMVLHIKVEEATPYALSGAYAGLKQEGVTDVPMKKGALREGEQTLRLKVTVLEGSGGVTLSTSGDAKRITSGAITVGSVMVPAQTVRMLVLGTAIGAAGFTFRTVRNRREEETKDAERIL